MEKDFIFKVYINQVLATVFVFDCDNSEKLQYFVHLENAPNFRKYTCPDLLRQMIRHSLPR